MATTNQTHQQQKFSTFYHPIWIEFGMGAYIGQKTNEFEMAMAIFWFIRLTNQNQKFGMRANFGQKRDKMSLK